MHMSIKILAELSKKLFSDIILFTLKSTSRALACNVVIDVISTSIPCEYPALKSVGAISPMLKSLAPKTLEDVRSGDVVGVLTLLVGGVAQAFHDDRVVELRVQLGVEEVDGKGQEGTGRSRKGETSQRGCAMDGMEMVTMRLRT